MWKTFEPSSLWASKKELNQMAAPMHQNAQQAGRSDKKMLPCIVFPMQGKKENTLYRIYVRNELTDKMCT